MSAKKRTAESEERDPDLPKPGEHLLYVPGPDHWHETDAAGDYVFDFEHAEDGPPVAQGRRAAKGEKVEGRFAVARPDADPKALPPLGRVESVAAADGTLHLSTGHKIRPLGPKKPWRGVVREEMVQEYREVEVSHEDGILGPEKIAVPVTIGKRLFLDVKHPNGVWVLQLPLEGEGAVPHDPEGGPHTWHRPKE